MDDKELRLACLIEVLKRWPNDSSDVAVQIAGKFYDFCMDCKAVVRGLEPQEDMIVIGGKQVSIRLTSDGHIDIYTEGLGRRTNIVVPVPR